MSPAAALSITAYILTAAWGSHPIAGGEEESIGGLNPWGGWHIYIPT